MAATAHRAGQHQGISPVDDMRTVIETLVRHRWLVSQEDGTFFFASPCLRVTAGVAVDHEIEQERDFAVWSVCGFDPDAVDSPTWVVEFGPGTPDRVVLGCMEYTAGALASGSQLPLAPGSFHDNALPVLERGWQRRVHPTPEAYKGASLFHMAVTDPGQTMRVEHLRDGWKMSLGDRATCAHDRPRPRHRPPVGSARLPHDTPPCDRRVLPGHGRTCLRRRACRSCATPRERARPTNGQRGGGRVSRTRSLTRTSPFQGHARSMPAAQPRPAPLVVHQLLTTLEGLRHARRSLSPHRQHSRTGQRARKAPLPGRRTTYQPAHRRTACRHLPLEPRSRTRSRLRPIRHQPRPHPTLRVRQRRLQRQRRPDRPHLPSRPPRAASRELPWQLECTERTPHELVEALAHAVARHERGSHDFDAVTEPLRAAGWREDTPGQTGDASKFIARRIASPDGYATFTEMDMAEVRHPVGPMTYRWRLEASSAWHNAWCIDATRDAPTAVLLAANLAVTDPSPVRRPAWARTFPGIAVTRPAAPPPTSGPSTVIPPTCAEVRKPRGH